MMRGSLLVAAALLLSLAEAHAEPTDASKADARHHYDAGLAHFNLREYPQAIEEFQAAYRTLPDPVFLYNLAQSYRLSNNAEQALYFYQTYLRNAPDSPNRAEVEGRIETLQKLIAEKRNSERPPDQTLPPADHATPRAATPAVVVAATPPSPANDRTGHKPVYRRWWFWTITGAVAVGAAVGFGVGFGLQKGASFNANVGTFGPSALTVRFSK